MPHMILEAIPFLLGTVFGYTFSGARLSRAIGLSLSIGFLSAVLAGEWTSNLPSAMASVLVDSAGALAGWKLACMAFRRIAKGGNHA